MFNSLGGIDASWREFSAVTLEKREVAARVTAIMAEISSAGRQQEAGIGQINRAISSMDDVTQQNAALVEQAAAAAEALHEQAGNLAQVVGVFRLDASAPAAAPVTPISHARAPAKPESSTGSRPGLRPGVPRITHAPAAARH